MQNKKGFTLIELLVVILIIGILAAIALPQYQLARDKAQFSNFQRLVKSIKTAVDDYMLINNVYPTTFDELNIDFSSSYSYTNHTYSGQPLEGCVIFQDSYCCVGKTKSGYQSDNITCGRNDYIFAYSLYSNKPYCISANENKRAQRLCENYDYNKGKDNNLITPSGHNTNNGKKYSFYLLN